MQEWVLGVGDANVTERGEGSILRSWLVLEYPLLTLKPHTFTHSGGKNPTTDDYFSGETYLKPAEPSKFPLKMEIRLIQEYTQLDTISACLSLSGLALFVYICLSLIA